MHSLKLLMLIIKVIRVQILLKIIFVLLDMLIILNILIKC